MRTERRSTTKTRRGPAASDQSLRPRSERIIEGLEKIFVQEGFRRVSVGELAARLHCSRQTLYVLAPSKEHLFLLVLDQMLHRIRWLGAEAAAANGDVRDRIVALVKPGVSELRSASSLFFADIADLPVAKRMLEQHQTARRAEVEKLIDEGVRKGAFRGLHTRLAAEVILATCQRALDPSFLAEVDLSPSQALAEAEDLLLHGLLSFRRTSGTARTHVRATRQGRPPNWKNKETRMTSVAGTLTPPSSHHSEEILWS